VSRTTLDTLDAALPPPSADIAISPGTDGHSGIALRHGTAGPARSDPAGDEASDYDVELLLKALPEKWRDLITKPEPTGGDRSRTVFRVIKQLGERGISPELIERLIRMHPGGVGAKFVARKDLAEEIRRVLSKQTRRQAMREEVGAARAGKAALLLIPGLLPESLDQAENHLLVAGVDIYQRGDFVVRPGAIERRTAAGEILRKPGLVPVTPYNMVELFTSVIDFQTWDNRSNEWRSIDCPLPFATAYLQRTRRWRLRPLTAIITAPTLRPDASILETPGYDAQTGILYYPLGVLFPPVPQDPTEEDALVALDELTKPLREVTFELDPRGQNEDEFTNTSASRSSMLSAILTAVIRPSLRTAPAHGFSAPVAGSGKSKMVGFVAMVATGQEAASFVPAQDDVELAKQIGSVLIDGDTIIALDNCDHVLTSAMLAQALTEILVKVRILGRSEMCTVLNTALFTITGNNLKLAGDLPRRALRSVIDPKVERPELREFASEDPIIVARRERPRLVIAALTILRAYYLAKKNPLSRPLGSFEDWSRWVRDALIWLGESDPCITMRAIRDEDPELGALKTVMAQWEAWLGYNEFTGQQIIARATWTDDKPLLPGFEQLTSAPELREALLGVAGKNGAINSQKLGNFLARYKDRIVDNRRFVRTGVLNGHTKWRLEPAS
jgi:hypothetical protein